GEGFRALAFLVISQGEAIVDDGLARRQFQGVLVILNRRARVAALRIVVRQPFIAGPGGRTLFQPRGKVIFGSAPLEVTQVLPIARSVVEPDVSRQLVVAVNRSAQAFSNGLIAESAEEGRVDLQRRLREVESHERRVGFSPDRRPRTSSRGDNRMSQFCAAVSYGKISG